MSRIMTYPSTAAIANRANRRSPIRRRWTLIAALYLVMIGIPAQGQEVASVGVRLASDINVSSAAWIQASIIKALSSDGIRPQSESIPMALPSGAPPAEVHRLEVSVYQEDPTLPLVVHRISRGRLTTLQARYAHILPEGGYAVVVPGTVAPLATPAMNGPIIAYPLAGQRYFAVRDRELMPLQLRFHHLPDTSRLASHGLGPGHGLPLSYPQYRWNRVMPPMPRGLWPTPPWLRDSRHAPLPTWRWWLLDPGPAWPP